MLKGLIVFSFPKKLFLSWKSKTWNQQCPQLSSITAIRFPITSALTCQGLPNSCLLSHPGLRAGAFLTKMRCTPRFAHGISRVRTHTHAVLRYWWYDLIIKYLHHNNSCKLLEKGNAVQHSKSVRGRSYSHCSCSIQSHISIQE